MAMTLEHELLASYLDDGGWHCEAENVREEIDLESYENELQLIDWLRRHHLTQPAQAVDVEPLRKGFMTAESCGPDGHHLLNVKFRSLDDLQAAHNAIIRALAGEKAEGWRPIATAPKDGTRIMLANKDASWMGEYCPVFPSGYRTDDPWQSAMLNMDHLPREKRYGAPTHWQPLPTPPTDGEG